jgi:hypothetical protein
LNHIDNLCPEEDARYPYQRCVAAVLNRIYERPPNSSPTGQHEHIIEEELTRVETTSGERRFNLLVASPTGSGKTFAIQHAATLARSSGSRLFVCEPLVALAVQIYRRLGGRSCPDICLRTGLRCQGEAEAPIQVCTFEVLCRSLERRPDFLAAGCPAVIIDEFHAIAGDRGPVLCELLTLCGSARPAPSIVALSGTLPNALEVGQLLSRINDLPTLITGARRRPVPIFFELWHPGAQNLATLPEQVSSRVVPDARCIGNITSKNQLLELLRCLERENRTPALIVNFSCRCLDRWAEWAASVDWGLDRSQKSAVTLGFDSLASSVEEADRPLFEPFRSLALRGVATHHSHRPAQYLELVSALAERRCLPWVFSTSTLSAGINLPVKTVVLASARIPGRNGDETVVRDLDAALFHQLVGRAGRPGFETAGFCVFVGVAESQFQVERLSRTAQWLRDRPAPDIKVNSEVDVGAVLRALRLHRNICVDRRAFDGRVAAEVRARDRVRTRLALSVSMMDERQRPRALRYARDVATVLGANQATLVMARVKHPTGGAVVRLVENEGGIFVRHLTSAENVPKSVSLSCAKPCTRFPFEYHSEILELRHVISRLAEHQADADEAEEAQLAKLFVEVGADWSSEDRFELVRGYGDDAYVQLCRNLISQDFLDVDGCVLSRGLAACEFRTAADPVSATKELFGGELLLERAGEDVGRNSAVVDLAAAASRWTGDERVSDTAGATLEPAVRQWVEGASLVELSETVPPGLFFRHITRVADVLREAEAAVRSLNVQDTGLIERALRAIERGLPFAQRGSDYLGEAS